MTSPEKVITREVSALLSLLAEFCSDDPRRAALAVETPRKGDWL